jgi:hypothetical protein
MSTLPEMVREYCAILDEEQRLSRRKGELRSAILAELTVQRRWAEHTPF